MEFPHLQTSLAQLLSSVRPATARILDRALSDNDIDIDEAAYLFDVDGSDLLAIIAAADYLRSRTVGDVVTYVVNRNINFTNVCVKACGFCAFSRGHLAEEGYFLPIEEIIRRATEAHELGATEVCVQAGLAPGMDGWHYVKLCRAVKEASPDLHVHGFSPEEVLYGATLTGASIREYLLALKEAGVGSLPGTSAEILVDNIRQQLSPGRISTNQWIELIQTAHEVGIPTTSTIMYGHIESSHDKAIHLGILRDIQRRTGGITEFVPLSFVYEEAPMFHRRRLAGLRQGASGAEVMKMYAVSRLVLNRWIPNLQVSWVKEGPKLSQVALLAGANDFGGTLINESISTAAGAGYGQLMKPSQFRSLIREMGRVPAERSTTYQRRRVFQTGENQDDLLDGIKEPAERFGSYQHLIGLKEYRFRDFYRQQKEPKQ
ncbi:MAG TPA: 5-amino-6-(D-ribitylamino)uracil--L-tyrosine 4-hydroxyphenyl transferase CofH [Candidatus Udaeobacter sp.]|jgi:7,8-didemethyl-8-hydroxy-5-deazariboflavin synthase CofH subunit|nr:5-amino-6-(D-ribitylamino)uracil--L-tyrosine 4-hydroxyphenyl transferase CofH [Candidatus Udaeobacter sp.]